MAHKTKVTLMRVAWEKIKRANAQRARENIEKRTNMKGGDGQEERRADSMKGGGKRKVGEMGQEKV